MTVPFGRDPYPGRPRILFVGDGTSSHSHAWIDLLAGARLNVRLFALPTLDPPPATWPVRTYLAGVPRGEIDRRTRRSLNPRGRLGWAVRHLRAAAAGSHDRAVTRWLIRIVRRWRPHVVHTLGLQPASYLWLDARRQLAADHRPVWVAQARGGPDLALHRFVPEHRLRLEEVLAACDELVADNARNYEIAVELGLPRARVSRLGVVPGTGGVDVPAGDRVTVAPSRRRRVILWPKAYDCPQSLALPVLEALRLGWRDLAPATVHLLAASPVTQMWCRTLPEEMQASFVVRGRIPRQQLLELMAQARVLLAPSLSEGVPNVLYEAMAHGAFPVVSPLETVTGLVAHERNVLFARNLYPNEIAAELVRAMRDDAMVDAAADRNLGIVRRVADRSAIAAAVAAHYEGLASSHAA